MNNKFLNDMELVCIIANYGLGKKIEKFAKCQGAKYSSCTYGMGSANNGLMNLMGLSDVRKEIVYIIINSEKAETFLENLDNKFKFYKPNHGIAFTISITGFIGCHCDYNVNNSEDSNMSDLITIIVDKGKAEEVIAAASKAGAKGGTIINARGAGSEFPCQKIFAMEIEPEKEIVIIISESNKTDNIVNSIESELHLREPNSGILFVQPVKRTLGIQK